jgi:RND family efflux transporter MFP subunit
VRKRYAIGGVAVLVLATGGAWAWRSATPRATKPRVAVTAATRGEFVVSLLAEGPLESEDSVVVRTGKAPGQLTNIAADGTMVKAGDVFCRIEARDLLRKQADAELAYKQASEEIETARENSLERFDTDQRQLVQAQTDFDVWQESVATRTKQSEDQLAFDKAEADRLRTEYDRTKRLADKGYVAGSEADIAQAAYDAQRFKVAQSEKDLEVNRSQIAAERRQKEAQLAATRRRTEISQGRISGMVERAQRRAEVRATELANIVAALADTTIKAPASGTVSLFSTWRGGERRPWREGDQVSSGTPLASISGSENMVVRSRIKESSIASIRKGAEAEIEFAALPGRKYRGVVSSVGSVAREVWVWEDPTAEANERVFDVLVKVAQAHQQGLKPGLNARVRITVTRLPKALFVPLEAVFTRQGKSVVYVAKGDDFVRREVQVGERNDVAVVIRGGLSGGETVALSDPTRLRSTARKSR